MVISRTLQYNKSNSWDGDAPLSSVSREYLWSRVTEMLLKIFYNNVLVTACIITPTTQSLVVHLCLKNMIATL